MRRNRAFPLTLSLALAASSPPALAWAPDWSDPRWPLQVFSHPCADVDTSGSRGVTVHCAPDGSVAALVSPVDFHLGRRLGATELWQHQGPGPDGPRRRAATVYALGELILVESVTCPGCVRVMGQAMLFRPSTAPRSLLAEAQLASGVRHASYLRTVQAWRAARP